jgi:uncharacterized OB-fold protein
MSSPAVPAVEGWFTLDRETPHLLGTKCGQCGTSFFPREEQRCRNPQCGSTDLDEVELSRTGTIWSYTNAGYQPPEPFVAADPFEPFAIAAVHLVEEDMVVLGQVITGVGVEELTTGMEMELVLETLFIDDDGTEQIVWKWAPVRGGDS